MRSYLADTPSNRPNKPSEVGVTKTNGRILIYSRVPRDEEGWVDAALYLPMRGDLVFLKIGEREVVGWWAGAYWYGSKGKPQGIISKWKLADFDHETSKFKTEESQKSDARMEGRETPFRVKERTRRKKPKASRRHRPLRSAQKG